MKKIGLLGGGQLGRMFLQNAINYPYQIHVLDPNSKAPCREYAHHFYTGAFSDYDTVYNFGKKVDTLTIEIESVNVDALKQLEQEGVNIFPQSKILEIIQDKRLQKQFYQDHDIPTSPFVLIDSPADLPNHVDFLPAFLKQGKEGYDGKGVMPIEQSEDFSNAFDLPSLLEKKVDVYKEISVIVARNPSGEIKSFPIVEMVFDPELNLVDYLLSPAQLSDTLKTQAQQIAHDIIGKLEMVGILAVEMFVTKEQAILVNEIAPRPHNSGHQSIEGNYTSQYDQHLRSIMDLPLGNTETRQPSAMLNIIGQGREGIATYHGLQKIMALPNVYLHLYGKEISKPGRKMGHITLLADDYQTLLDRIDLVKASFQCIGEA